MPLIGIKYTLTNLIKEILVGSLVISIDGPAASGKDTVGKLLSVHLGYTFIDTGVMYRAITWLALEEGIDPSDSETIVRLALESEIKISSTLNATSENAVIVNGVDSSHLLHGPEVDSKVSLISQIKGVRDALLPQQRALARGGRVVMTGRDIGTKVFPDAAIKIYLEASVNERARRRFAQQNKRGQILPLPQVLGMIEERDRLDAQRSESPLRPADDAVIIDTDNMDPTAVVDAILERIRVRCQSAINPS